MEPFLPLEGQPYNSAQVFVRVLLRKIFTGMSLVFVIANPVILFKGLPLSSPLRKLCLGFTQIQFQSFKVSNSHFETYL